MVGSPATGRKAGTIILLHKNLPHTIHSIEHDDQGRKLSLHITIASREVQLTSIYAPNSPSPDFWREAATWLIRQPSKLHIMSGDFNTVMSKDEDRKTRSPSPLSTTLSLTIKDTPLASMISSLDLVDFWRLDHPTDREFSFYSPPHDSLARLDYFFSSKLLTPLIRGSEIHEIAISDHAPVSITIEPSQNRSSPKIWKYPSYLAQSDDLTHHIEEFWSEYSSLMNILACPFSFGKQAKQFLGGKYWHIPPPTKRQPTKNLRQPAKSLDRPKGI